MEGMSYQIFLDLDGSGLLSHNEISKNLVKVADKLHDLGHLVYIVTGRQAFSAFPYHRELNLSTHLVAMDGALIYREDGGLVESNLMDSKFVKAWLTSEKIQSLAYSSLIQHENMSELLDYAEISQDYITSLVPVRYNYNLSIRPQDGKYKQYGAIQLENIVPNQNLKHFIKALDDMIVIYPSIKYELFDSKPGLTGFIIKSVGVSKATAVNSLKQPRMMTMAIGDGVNDVDMMKLVDTPVLMANSKFELIKALFSIEYLMTEKIHKEDGVALFLNDFFELNVI